MTEVTLYTFAQFLADQNRTDDEAEEEKLVEEEVVVLASEGQLESFHKSIGFLVDRHRLNKSALMRAVGEPNKQIHHHFSSEHDVPLSELEAAAVALGLPLNDLLTLPDWYPVKAKRRQKMLKHQRDGKLIRQ